MATVTLQSTGKVVKPADVSKFLESHSVTHQVWPVPASLRDLRGKAQMTDADKARTLDGYRKHLDHERDERGYVQSDMIVLNASTPGLDALLAKFDKAHYHDDDEVRYIFDGEGIFGFEGRDGVTFTILVKAGDYIIIPAKCYHWFTLTESRAIKAIRLFKDMSGWAPHYKEAARAMG